MLAQFTFTPTEGKKLVARAVAGMDEVRRALAEGIIVMHPSTSTWFLYQEFTGKNPEESVWVCGVNVRGGACIEAGIMLDPAARAQRTEGKFMLKHPNPKNFNHSWTFKQGVYKSKISLGEIAEEMQEGDIYVKGVNALDPQGNVGVLAGHHVEGGTFAYMLSTLRKKNVSILYPVGLEKMVPTSVKEVSGVARRQKYSYSMGISCSLVAADYGTPVTELTALEALAGVKAYAISCGGLEGAEGSVTIVVEGADDQVQEAIRVAESVKGASLPKVRIPGCSYCIAKDNGLCLFPLKDRPWPHI